ncbi:MAG: S8 family peptidase [Candidatus Hydrogenedentes bacterium]|nr:S8 family peptidase [Candidatus Hydrogenedentota bacterium]
MKDRDEEDVPRAVQNNNHGSFVAGLLANARRFNHNDLRFPNTPARIVDVVAMPADAGITEDDLLDIIRRALTKYPKVRVWNLSISNVRSVCQNDAFSDFAMALDELQDKHKVTFVICAGNYVCQPLRGWPPGDLGEGDRIFPPADSVRALTVGSLAHYHQADSRVKSEEPSPFSRRGPGPAFIPKPEVCHYGGNCTADLDFSQVGILSVDARGNVAEDIGTSFSTPIVASLLAHVYEGVADPVSTNLAKALVVHSAALQSDSVDAQTLKYRGFGVPREVADMLTCTPWQATLVFQPQLPPDRRIFNPRIDFPIPKCFRRADGKVEGEFLMTLVYDPPLGRGAGAEYCRVNVDVSLGTYDIRSRSGKREHKGLIPPEPADVGKLYEEYQVKHGFKWSPVKVYRKRLCRVEGKAWRLQIRVLYRDKQDLRRPQNVALVLTMFDPTRQKPVYDDVVASMRQLGWVTQDLRVHGRVRGIIR